MQEDDPMGETVSLVNCHNYAYPEIRRALEAVLLPLGGIGAYVTRGDRVLLKPNLLYGKHPDKAVTTHPMVVKAVCELVLEQGGIPLIGDSPGIGTLHRVAEQTGMTAVASELGCSLADFSIPITVRLGPEYTFRAFEIVREVLDADVIINLPKLKTHGMMFLTLAVKNTFGCVPGMQKAQWHLKAGNDHDSFGRMLVELNRLVSPALSLVDGIVAMEGNGPGSGVPRPLGVLVAGHNPRAVDTTICHLLCLHPDILPTTRAAREQGLAGTELDDIDVVGPPLESLWIDNFRLPRRVDPQWGLPRAVTRPLKHVFLPKPMIRSDQCTGCGTCRDVCPAGAITFQDDCPQLNYAQCIRCYCCQEMCPEGAIHIGRAWFGRRRT
jgi:uncharacterized protein (DUF362 family)